MMISLSGPLLRSGHSKPGLFETAKVTQLFNPHLTEVSGRE